MKVRLILTFAFVCAVVFCSAQPASAILYGNRGDERGIQWVDGIADWKLEGVGGKVNADGTLTVSPGAERRGILMYQGGNNADFMANYDVETFVRKKKDGNYFALHARVNKPAKDFYLIEISYGSNTVSTHACKGGKFNEITPGGNAGRPKRPEPKKLVGGDDTYTMKFEVKGDNIKYWIDDVLMIATADKSWKTGPPGLGAQDTTMIYEWIRIDTIPPGRLGIQATKKQLAVDSKSKLAVTWGRLKN